MRLTYLAAALLASTPLALAQTPGPLESAVLQHTGVITPTSALLTINVPANFPLPASQYSVTFQCGHGVPGHTSDALAFLGLPERWREWVDLYNPTITSNLFSVQGYTLGCDDKWFYLEAPSFGALDTYKAFGFGVAVGGGNTPWLLMRLPYSEPLQGSSLAVVRLLPSLPTRFYTATNSAVTEIERADIAATRAVVIAVRQNGPLQPLLFEQQLHPVTIDPNQPFDFYYSSGPYDQWHHVVVDKNAATIAIAVEETPPSNAAQATTTLAEIRASIASAAEAIDSFDITNLRTVVVQPGQTLWTIAAHNNVSVAGLISVNCLTSERVYAGQVLAIPNPETRRRC